MILKRVIQYKGQIKFNHLKPDGMLRKYLDIKKMKKTKWRPKIKFVEGISRTYENYKA